MFRVSLESHAWAESYHLPPASRNAALCEHGGQIPQFRFGPLIPAPWLFGNGLFQEDATMATLIDAEVQHVLSEGRETACTLLTEHRSQLTRLAQALMEHEQLNRVEFEEVLQ